MSLCPFAGTLKFSEPGPGGAVSTAHRNAERCRGRHRLVKPTTTTSAAGSLALGTAEEPSQELQWISGDEEGLH